MDGGVAVIGSGVAGVFAAQALAERGLRVTMLDVGEQLDEQRTEIVAKLRAAPDVALSAAEEALIRHNSSIGTGGLLKKMHFGSDYIYASDRPFARLRTLVEGRAPYPTFARGGFSNIWGAAVLPPDGCDMAGWPLSRTEMEPHFRAVAALLPLCGGDGTLSLAFPAYRDRLEGLDPGPQGALLLADLKAAERQLLGRDTLYGKARLAVHTSDEDGALACTGCGECFLGCARGSIFSTVPMLERLIRCGSVRYQPGTAVMSVGEAGEGVTVDALQLPARQARQWRFDRIFLAAGPINSTRILLRSRALYGQVVSLKESQKFVLPLLRWRAAETAIERPSATLASVFLETKIPALSDHWVHLQFAPMNRTIVEGLGLAALAQPRLGRMLAPVLRRAMVAWCGLHSDHSSAVELCLRPDRARGSDILEMNLAVSQPARAAARRVAWDLFHKGRLFRATFLPWLIRFSNPGSGTHCGSSFPMREQPTVPLDSDRLGRPFGWSRIFVVDSSVLPSIPGTTLAFAVMANAYRIASTAPL
jgi:choline dehydrogenase-like flavoprotein